MYVNPLEDAKVMCNQSVGIATEATRTQQEHNKELLKTLPLQTQQTVFTETNNKARDITIMNPREKILFCKDPNFS